ncbi:hypothetical protein DPMN_095178 [Dreissena polymorpha]|uniref:HYR domain-containing protein n=1 Tax=Dreissena polymorpha TaxID=45954 RepID=A0A9D4L607_DREPO|nr:hypothetical protein DPMN_095178 [Dreissena polymorpha]
MCSSHVFYSGTSTAMVNWPEPVVKDNVDLNIKAEKLSNINQGDTLEEGTYLIPYRATDSA